ncbi:MAG TPA: hypothetical protein VHC49_10415 [Mycobacteriales bacterium]|nr:hypothetical protein [Mycobacteriales bacterium]
MMRQALLHPIVVAVSAAAALAALWMIAFPTWGTDLSAQLARADFASNYPSAAYDFSWYSGIYPASYSLLAPYVFAVAGTRQVAAGAAVVSAGLIAWMFVRHRLPAARWAALWIGVGLGAGLLAGRATFTLGLAAATAAVAVVDASRPSRPWRLVLGAVLGLLASLFSPLAGAFIGIAAVAFILTRRVWEGITIGAAAALPLCVVAILFGSGGLQPITILNGGPALALAILVYFSAPHSWRVIRIGAAVYAVAVVGAWVMPSAVGSNIERLGLLLGGPLLIATTRHRRRALAICGLVIAVGWQIAIPGRDLLFGKSASAPASTTGLISALKARHADTARVEAVPQYGHWESEQLAAVVPLARGWERQLDTVRNPIFYGDDSGKLTPDRYRTWLHDNAVHYVAISDAIPDYAAKREAQIVRAGQPWLTPVWHDKDWTLYQVADPTPLASTPARVVQTTPAQLTLSMPHAGSTVIRIRWSRFLDVDNGGRLDRSGEFTTLSVPAAGTYRLSGHY